MNRSEVLTDFSGEVCSICGGWKRKMNSFCTRCYLALPPKKRAALYLSFGDGYEEAFTEAQAYLREALPHAREEREKSDKQK